MLPKILTLGRLKNEVIESSNHQEAKNLHTSQGAHRFGSVSPFDTSSPPWPRTWGGFIPQGPDPCANEPLGVKGPPLVGEEVRNKDVGKVGSW